MIFDIPMLPDQFKHILTGAFAAPLALALMVLVVARWLRPFAVAVALPSGLWRKLRPRKGTENAAWPEAGPEVRFRPTPRFNPTEARLLPVLEAAIRDFGAGHRLIAAARLGDLLSPCETTTAPDLRKRLGATLSKEKLDFAILDRAGHIVAAIVIAGQTRDGTTGSAMRREVLATAGIPLIEVAVPFDRDDLNQQIRAALRPRRAAR